MGTLRLPLRGWFLVNTGEDLERNGVVPDVEIWDAHLVSPETEETPGVLYIDLHLIHEVTSPQAFEELRQRGLKVRQPNRTVATMDHAIPTRTGSDGRRAEPEGAAADPVGAQLP